MCLVTNTSVHFYKENNIFILSLTIKVSELSGINFIFVVQLHNMQICDMIWHQNMLIHLICQEIRLKLFHGIFRQ